MNRRQFLGTASAAVGLAAFASRSLAAAVSKDSGLIDVNVTLGRWPFRRLALDETGRLVAKLRAQGVRQAWAGSFDAVFGRDLPAANAGLAKQCRKQRRDFLRPFGSVNPLSPDWQAELSRCAEEHHMPGLRLFPGYHGYKLGDERVAKLFALAAEKNLILQIAADLEDERLQRKEATAPHTDAKPLLALLKAHPGTRVILLNWHRSVPAALVTQLAAAGAHFDIATVENVGGVGELVGKISAEQVLFGSHAPFFYFESAQLKLQESALTGSVLQAVAGLNARRLLG